MNPIDIMTNCQHTLDRCKIQTVETVRLQRYILRLKKALLEHEVETCSECIIQREFVELYNDICKLCGASDEYIDVNMLITRINKLINNVKTH